jgi:sugar phosphate isomerase/epimerase
MFGEGELDFPPILKVLADNKYTGLVNVELSRDSHRAPEVCRRSLEFLQAACKKIVPSPATP